MIEVQNLTKTYVGRTAVDGLSFTVNDGDVYGFLGQNGAGKSTTIRMLLTLVQPTGGEIELFGMKLSTPLLLAPVGVLSIAHPEAEIAVARAANTRSGDPR